MKLKKFIIPTVAGILTVLGLSLTIHAAPVPSIQALFETSLQASLTTNSTAATLVSGTDIAGNSLNRYYCFTVEIGRASCRERVCLYV